MRNVKKFFSKLLVSLFVVLLPTLATADRLIFVINTTENDIRGPVTAPYLDEHRWQGEWKSFIAEIQKLAPEKKIKVITIRASSNFEITRGLKLWLSTTLPNETPHEVAALAIYSHGGHMSLYNESGSFNLQLPTDLGSVFAPLVGRFSKGARVFIAGCNVLWGQTPFTAETSLKSMMEALELQEGVIYANYSKGFDPYSLTVSPFNSDVKPMKRITGLATYLIWPVSAPALPLISKYIYNQGYALRVAGNKRQLFKVQQSQIFRVEAFSEDAP